jgi:RNA polymerase sigma-70 factor (ECF subfamily)
MANLRKIFSKIYDRYIDKIYRFIFLKVNSQEIAQDLTSETFLRGWEAFKNQKSKIKNQKPIENPQAFLYQIARNLVIDYYREKGRAQVVSAEFAPIIDPNQNLEEKALLRSDINTVRLALADLKEDYQNVIIWHYLDDLPIPEIAVMLERTEEATRVLLSRALKTLREKIENSPPNIS